MRAIQSNPDMSNAAERHPPSDPQASANAVPSVFCWTKMGAEAGQDLSDILRRKDLERQSGNGIFAWGIGSSVGPAMQYARSAEHLTELEALFTPMRSPAKLIDSTPSRILMWLGYIDAHGQVTALPDHMLVTSRGHVGSGEDKRGHYALICSAENSLMGRTEQGAFDHRAVSNLVSAQPVGASQVTSVVRHDLRRAADATYAVLFRARLAGDWFVRLDGSVSLEGDLLAMYEAVCASQDAATWAAGMRALRAAADARALDAYPSAMDLFR